MTIVNKIPITKVDIVNRAKLISLSVDKNKNLKNLENYYNQSLKALINEKIIFSAGKKMSWSVSIHAESTGVTGAFELRPVQTDQEICKVPVM